MTSPRPVSWQLPSLDVWLALALALALASHTSKEGSCQLTGRGDVIGITERNVQRVNRRKVHILQINMLLICSIC